MHSETTAIMHWLLLVFASLCSSRALGQQQPLFMKSTDTQYSGSTVSVFVVADWGGVGSPPFVTDYELTTAAAMESLSEQLGSSVKAVFALGDNFYSDGVKSVTDARFHTTFEDVFKGKRLVETPWYLVAGNHDWRGNVSAQILYSKLSKRWNFPDYFHTKVIQLPDGECAAFIMVDTVLLSGSNSSLDPDFATPGRHYLSQPQLEQLQLLMGADNNKYYAWLERQLVQYQSCSYLFVAGHHPVWSMGYHGPTPELFGQFNPLLLKHRVTAYLCGHDHNMQHIVLNATDYIVAGAAAHVKQSAQHKSLFPPGSIRFYWDQPGDREGAFLLLSFGRGHANATFVESGTTARRLYETRLLPRHPELPAPLTDGGDDSIL